METTETASISRSDGTTGATSGPRPVPLARRRDRDEDARPSDRERPSRPRTLARTSAVRWLLPALALAAATSARAGAPRCFSPSREGHCIAVTINGQATVRLAKKTRKMLEPLDGLRFGGDETRYEAAAPIRGALEVRAEWTAGAEEYFGTPPEVSLHLRPLEGQELETRPELSTAPSVTAEGGAVLTRSEVADSRRLPPGKYLLSVSLNGPRNWDRQTTYFEVAK